MKHTTKVTGLLLVLTIICISNTSGQLAEGIFKFISTVKVTPDAMYLTGSFARINYIPGTNHFFVSFGTKASTQTGICNGAGYAYKEYSLDMQETGISGLLDWYANGCEAGDAGSTMADNIYYFVSYPQEPDVPYGLRITKFEASNWTRLGEKYVYMIDTNETNSDPCVAFVNGQLDISDQYNSSGIWQEGTTSRHHFFSPDLDSLTVRILDDSPNISGASMIYIDGVYYLISANKYDGDLVVLKYDNAWNFLGMKKLVDQANWSQGVTTDGQRFYVAYQDTRLRTDPDFFPVYNNIHLAAFDREWNIVDDVAVTNFDTTDHYQPGRPWVLLHNNLLYVSYDIDSIDQITHEEMRLWQARVSIYELTQSPTDIGQETKTLTGNYLEQNYPNPFRTSTTINYQIKAKNHITLKVVDITGREIVTIVDGIEEPGYKSVSFDGQGLANGVYYYYIRAGNYVESRKLLIIRQQSH